MNKAELLEALRACNGDPESDHRSADTYLLDHINDPDITAAFEAISKWYA